MTKKIWTQLNAFERPKAHEKNTGELVTVPDQTISVKEMVQRHRAGLPVEGTSAQPIYHEGEEPLKNMDHLDLVDRQRYIDSVADALVDLKARIQQQAKNQKEREFMNKVDEAVRLKLAEIRDLKDVNKISDIKPES